MRWRATGEGSNVGRGVNEIWNELHPAKVCAEPLEAAPPIVPS